MIFHPSKKFYGWNLDKQHLHAVVHTGYLSQIEIDQLTIIDLQDRFKQWYNKTFKHKENCPVSSADCQADDPSCICPYRPHKHITDKWDIFKAFQHVLYKHLIVPDQSYLSGPRYTYCYMMVYHSTLKTFLMIVEYDWDLAQLTQYKQLLKS